MLYDDASFRMFRFVGERGERGEDGRHGSPGIQVSFLNNNFHVHCCDNKPLAKYCSLAYFFSYSIFFFKRNESKLNFIVNFILDQKKKCLGFAWSRRRGRYGIQTAFLKYGI